MYDEHNKENKAQNSKPNGDQNANEAYHWNTPAPESSAYRSGAGARETFPQSNPQQQPPPEPQSTQRPPYVQARAVHTPEHRTPLYEREHKRFGSGFHGGGSGHSGSGSGAKKNGAGQDHSPGAGVRPGLRPGGRRGWQRRRKQLFAALHHSAGQQPHSE